MNNFYSTKINPTRLAVVDLVDLDPRLYIDEFPEVEGPVKVITRINVPRGFQGQGFGSRLLNQVLEDADIEEVNLALEINPYGMLDYDGLRAWYERHGFEEIEDTGVFLRRHNQESLVCILGQT